MKIDTGSCEEDLEWEEWNPSKITFVKHMIAGSVAGLVEHVSIYPIDTIKTHIQYEKSASFQPLHSFKSLLKGEGGFFRLWRGVSAMFAGCIPAHSAYFAVFEASKVMFGADKEGHHPVQAAACGVLAAISHDSFLAPFDVVKQRMQLGYYKNVVHCVRTILRNEGVGALYISFPTTLMMNIPYGGVMVAVNESMKKILNPDGEYNFWTTMISGSIAGTIAAAATNPLDVVKTRLQTQNLEHCTRSCEDPVFNPTGTPPRSSSGAARGPIGGSASSAGISSAPLGRPPRGGKAAGSGEGPMARPYRRGGRPLIPQTGGIFDVEGASEAQRKLSTGVYSSIKDGMLWRKGTAASSQQQHTQQSSARGGMPSSHGIFSTARVPNVRMRALMTSAHPRHTLGSYKSSRTGGMLFTIDRRAVVRALSGSSPQQGTISAGEGALNTLGMRDMFKQILAEEGVRGFARGVVPRMLVHAPSVAISWTAYESMKCLLMEH